MTMKGRPPDYLRDDSNLGTRGRKFGIKDVGLIFEDRLIVEEFLDDDIDGYENDEKDFNNNT